jgi:hypothetical protein
MTNLKNIKINEELHNQLKAFCAIRGLKVGKFVEQVISSSISKETKDDDFGDLHNNKQD